MTIKNAKVLTMIGTERNSFEDKADHVLTMVIEAKNINPEEFIGFNGKMSLKIEKE